MKCSNVNKQLAALVPVGTILAACGSDSSGGADDTGVELDSGRSGGGADGREDVEDQLTETESTPAMEDDGGATDDTGGRTGSEPDDAQLDSGDDATESGAERRGRRRDRRRGFTVEWQQRRALRGGRAHRRERCFGRRRRPIRRQSVRGLRIPGLVAAADDPLSTFALDVDTGSYSVGRRFLDEGSLPPHESVRPEEYVNAFDYDYETPRDGLDISVDGGPSPFGENNVLVRIGVQGEVVDAADRGNAALTFVIDTSGSMDRDDRLGLVKESLTILVDELNDDDTVAMVTYSDASGIVLQPTPVSDRDTILDAIADLGPGGSTNLGIRPARRLWVGP